MLKQLDYSLTLALTDESAGRAGGRKDVWLPFSTKSRSDPVSFYSSGDAGFVVD